MAALGGPAREASVDGRIFAVAGDADVNIDLGGVTVEHQMNGDGTVREVHTPKPWMFAGVVLSIDHDRDDLKFLQDVMDKPGPVPCTVTLVDGNTYAAAGKPSGDLKNATGNATCEVTMSGGGKAERQ